MEPNDDVQLRRLLREWKAPGTPSSLDDRVLASREMPQTWWRFFVRGYIRVPVPVACCLALLVFFAGFELTRRVTPGAPCVAAASAPTTQPVARELDRCRPAQSCS
jgi:hypothetical protein